MEVAGLILMGGKNSRMGGRKKAYLNYLGKPFYQWVAEAMGDIPIYLSVKDAAEREAARHSGYPIIEDHFSDIGPVGGITSGLLDIPARAVLTAPCDLPLLDGRLMRLLLNSYRKTGLPSVVESEGYINPLVAVYTRGCLPVLQAQIEAENYRASHCFGQLPHQRIDSGLAGFSPDCLQNINNWNEYIQLIKQTKGDRIYG